MDLPRLENPNYKLLEGLEKARFINPGFSKNSSLSFKDSKIIHIQEAFVFSIAYGEKNILTPIMSSARGINSEIAGYDSVVEIREPKQLAQEIFEHGRVVIDGREAAVKEIFNDVTFAQVNYGLNSSKIEDGFQQSSPLTKILKYKGQSEFRILLDPIDKRKKVQGLLIRIDDAERFFINKEKFEAQPSVAASSMSLADGFGNIEKILYEYIEVKERLLTKPTHECYMWEMALVNEKKWDDVSRKQQIDRLIEIDTAFTPYEEAIVEKLALIYGKIRYRCSNQEFDNVFEAYSYFRHSRRVIDIWMKGFNAWREKYNGVSAT